MDEAGDDEPARLVGGADRLGRLHRVLDLREVDVRIAVVDERVEEVEGFPDGQRLAVERQVLALLLEHEGERLVRVVERVELLDPRPGMRVVPELIDGLGQKRATGLACLHGILPDGRFDHAFSGADSSPSAKAGCWQSSHCVHPRPMNGILVAMTVMNCTLASSGRPAM